MPAPSACSIAPDWSSSARYGKIATVASRERAVELGRREVAEPPLGPRRVAQPVERHRRIAGHEQPRVLEPPHDLDRVGEPLVRPDHAEREQRLRRRRRARPRSGRRGAGSRAPRRRARASVSRPRCVCTTTRSKRAEQPLPELALLGRPPRQQVVRGEDRRRAEADERVGLRQRQPLHMQHVGAARGQRPDDARRARAPSAAAVPASAGTPATRAGRSARSAGSRTAAAAPRSGSARSRPRPRRPRRASAGGELVVVPRRVRRRICDHDAHGLVQ